MADMEKSKAIEYAIYATLNSPYPAEVKFGVLRNLYENYSLAKFDEEHPVHEDEEE
jgi:hypothetical protein